MMKDYKLIKELNGYLKWIGSNYKGDDFSVKKKTFFFFIFFFF